MCIIISFISLPKTTSLPRLVKSILSTCCCLMFIMSTLIMSTRNNNKMPNHLVAGQIMLAPPDQTRYDHFGTKLVSPKSDNHFKSTQRTNTSNIMNNNNKYLVVNDSQQVVIDDSWPFARSTSGPRDLSSRTFSESDMSNNNDDYFINQNDVAHPLDLERLPSLVGQHQNASRQHNASNLNTNIKSTQQVPSVPTNQHRTESSPFYDVELGDDQSDRQPPNKPIKSSRSVPGGQQESVDTSESKQIEQNSNCALILKRTYILKDRQQDEWGEKFVFNDVDVDDEKRRVHKSDLCIKHSEVDKAIEEAKHKLKFEAPDDLDSLEVSEASIAAVAELNLATGQLLTKKFDLSRDEILNALPMIDMASTKFSWHDLCPKHVRPMACSKSRYRTITAHCNNLKHPSWGATGTPYSRYLPPDYADGLGAPRAGRDGKPLPSARLITSLVHVDADEPSHDYSILFADWGQLLNHDITRVAVGEGKFGCLVTSVIL